jgi:hypothetical protein
MVLFINDSTPYGNWGGRGATTALRAIVEACGGQIAHTLYINELESSLLDGIHPAPEPPPSRLKAALKPLVPPAALDLRYRLASRPRGGQEGPSLIPRTWDEFEAAARRVIGQHTPWPALLRALERIDVAVVFGDGDIYGDHLLPRTLLFLSYVLKKHLGIPVLMVAHSAELDRPVLRTMAEHVYPLFDDVVFRDLVSREDCRGFCSGRFAPDPAFWFRAAPKDAWAELAARPSYFAIWPDKTTFDPRKPYLCVGGSSLIHAMDTREVVVAFSRLINRVRAVYDGQVVLTASEYVDDAVFRPLSEKLGLPLVGVTTPVQQAVDILGNADAYIGGRFHVAIFALRGGAPFVPLSAKTFKMEALAEMAGLPSETFAIGSLASDAGQIVKALSKLLQQGSELRSRLSSWSEEMAHDSLDNGAFITSLRSHG